MKTTDEPAEGTPIVYQCALPLSRQTLTFTADLLRAHLKKIGSRWRKLPPGKIALIVLATLRHDHRLADMAGGNGVSASTIHRWTWEIIGLLAARAPRLDRALATISRQGGEVVLLDGTLIATRRRSGTANRRNFSGKHKKHGLLFLALTDEAGNLIWISAAHRGAASEIRAARQDRLAARLREAGLGALADLGFTGLDPDPEDPVIITGYKATATRKLTPAQRHANQALSAARAPVEHGFSDLKLSVGPRPALINVNDDHVDRVLSSLLPCYLRGFSDEKEQGAMAYCLAVRPAGGDRTWTVVDASYATVGPVEEWLEAHRRLWSPNTIRGYAASLAQWWSFLEQRGEHAQWTEAGVLAVAGFLSWLRNGRTVEHSLTAPADVPSAETLHARLAALVSFYQWQEAVNSVPVAGRLLRGRPARMRSRGLLAHLDGRREPGPSSLVKVRRRRAGRPPLLLPAEIQAIIDGCATWDDTAGEWAGNLRDRLLFSILAETGMRLGEVMGMVISDFVMGRGGTAYVDVVPREASSNGARVKMMRPRRIYVSADLERLFADYLTHLACRAAGLGLDVSAGSPLLVNMDRPPLLAAIREGTVRDKVTALKKKGIGPAGWTPHWFRHSHASALLLAGTPDWVVSRRLGHAHVQTTLDLYGWVSEDEALRAAVNWKQYAKGWRTDGDR